MLWLQSTYLGSIHILLCAQVERAVSASPAAHEQARPVALVHSTGPALGNGMCRDRLLYIFQRGIQRANLDCWQLNPWHDVTIVFARSICAFVVLDIIITITIASAGMWSWVQLALWSNFSIWSTLCMRPMFVYIATWDSRTNSARTGDVPGV
jgi:hypothetical protein